jgi:hypothetical protein
MTTKLGLPALALVALLAVAAPVAASSAVLPAPARSLDAATSPVLDWSGLDQPIGRVGYGPWLLGLGLDVAPYRLLDPSASISFDLRLAWPLGPSGAPVSGLEPYLTLGPGVFLSDAPEIDAPLGPRGDASAVLGVKAGAGLTWRVDPGTALFGEYRMTRGAVDALRPAGHGSATDTRGFDVLYGVRFKF